jgi:exopolyphosphatase/guanosine-5'-triphosphate,3'-diphosphate pyrophosphatase
LRAKLEIIAGQREAELAFLSVAKAGIPGLEGQAYVVVDVGGGSTEFITTDGARVVSAVSIPIGAVRLTERHLKSDPPTEAELAALEADIDDRLPELPLNVPIIGTAGTATTLAAVSLALTSYDPDKVTGFRIDDVDGLYRRLAHATVAERKAMPGMEAQRADVIAGGAAIYARIMRRTAAPVFIACDRGIRWGLVYEG